MSNDNFGDVHNAVKVIGDYDRPWAVCGGWAIDLFIDRVARAHKDVDFAVLRKDQLIIQNYLLSRGWTLEKAIDGELIPWQAGEWIDLPVHVIWCKKPGSSPDFIELLFNEVDGIDFHFRRDPSITLPVEKMITSSAPGIPILAPEIVLLYKSLRLEVPSNTEDFRNVLPRILPEARDWLADALRKLYTDHIWLADLP